MTMPSPFEMGAKIGGNIGGAIQGAVTKSRDINTIDQMLQEASKSGRPEDIQDAMNNILSKVSPERQQMAQQILQNKYNQLQQTQQKQSAASYYQSQGINPNAANLPEGIQKEIIKGKRKESGEQNQGILGALDVVKRQRELLKSANLGPKYAILGTGRKAGSTFTKQGIKDRAEYERLGKSLISRATNIPIRNRIEFETLADKLFDPLAKQEEIEGSLDAMERILNNSLGIYSSSGNEIQSNQQYNVGQTATNSQTGKKLVFNGTDWVSPEGLKK